MLSFHTICNVMMQFNLICVISSIPNVRIYIYTYLDKQLDNEVEPVDLHQVQGKQHGIEGQVECNVYARHPGHMGRRVESLGDKPVQPEHDPI